MTHERNVSKLTNHRLPSQVIQRLLLHSFTFLQRP